MADFELNLDFVSRFKETVLLQKGGKVFFGRWTPPTIQIDGDEAKYLVTEQDKGTLDFIAFNQLGMRELWWAIALVNAIYHTPRDVVTGKVLTIPKIQNIYRALQKVDNRA